MFSQILHCGHLEGKGWIWREAFTDFLTGAVLNYLTTEVSPQIILVMGMYINSMKQLHNAVLHSLIECSKLTAYLDSLCVFVYKESDHVKWLCVLCPPT